MKPDNMSDLEYAVRQHEFSSYTYHPDPLVRELAVAYFELYKKLWKIENPEMMGSSKVVAGHCCIKPDAAPG